MEVFTSTTDSVTIKVVNLCSKVQTSVKNSVKKSFKIKSKLKIQAFFAFAFLKNK